MVRRASGQWKTAAGMSVAAFIVLSMSACTSVEPKIVTSDRGEPSGMEALLQASLEVDTDGCVYGQREGGRVTLVWPKGYSVRGDTSAFEILDADGERVAESGTKLMITGGATDTVGDAWEHQDCATDDLWMVGKISTS
jgi:hypothetical protein